MMGDRLSELIARFAGKRLLLYGDFALDRFVFGEVSRISREAPVLVLRYVETADHAGCGGNAAANLAALGALVSVVGLTGKDEHAVSLSRKLPPEIDTSGLLALDGCRTMTKTRILAGSLHSPRQQIVRLDIEPSPVPDQAEDQLWQLLSERVERCDGVVVSDYGLGAVQLSNLARLRQAARRRNVPILVDSRFRLAQISDVTAVTPNISEVEEATGIRIGSNQTLLESVGKKLRAEQQLDALLITRGRFGMSLFESGERVTHIPIYGSDEVADVTGAGDTVIATMALALTSGATFFEAAMLSNYAGGVVVMKHGTATVDQRELLEAVENDS